MTIREAQHLLEQTYGYTVGKSAICRWCRSGELPACLLVQSFLVHWEIDEADLVRVARQHSAMMIEKQPDGSLKHIRLFPSEYQARKEQAHQNT